MDHRGRAFERALKAIGTSTQETFAGASAFFAPTLGPAAPAAATGVAGAVSATALAGLPAFDIGSWSVPRTMAAVVHQGEMILPAGMAAAIRSGGGVTVNYAPNVQALDSRGVERVLMQHSEIVVKALAKEVRNCNPHTL